MEALTLINLEAVAARLQGLVRRTPCITFSRTQSVAAFGLDAELVFKLELLQVTGTFKARGALATLLSLTPDQRRNGVTTFSAGNHAIAVAFAARETGVAASVFMPQSSNSRRVELARSFGAEIVLTADGPSAYAGATELARRESRYLVHPFEGPGPVSGTASVGLEWLEQAGPLDAVVIAVGGGALIAGVGSALRAKGASTRIYGAEPIGAAGMHRSLAAGAPLQLDEVATIADSLAPPMTTPYTFDVCRRVVTEVSLVHDREIEAAMARIVSELKLAVEPAGAAALAAARAPLRQRLEGRRVGILICGSNIDLTTFARHIEHAQER